MLTVFKTAVENKFLFGCVLRTPFARVLGNEVKSSADFKAVVELSVVVSAVQYPLRVTTARVKEVKKYQIER